MCGRCGTHDPEMHRQMADEGLLVSLGFALAKRGGQPLEEVIYDAVTEALQDRGGAEALLFEDKSVGTAIDRLYAHRWSEVLGVGFSYEQGCAVADAYKKVLEQRGVEFARRWLDNLLAVQLLEPTPVLMQGWLRALMQTLGTETSALPALLSASDKPVRFSVYDARCDNGASYLCQSAGSDNVLRALAYRVNCQVRGAQDGLLQANVVRQHGEVDSTIKAVSGRGWYAWYGNEVAGGSTSSRLLSALEQNSGKTAHELARLWIEKWYPARSMVDMRSTVLKISLVALQLALGIDKEERDGIDWCHGGRISRGMRLVLTSPRGLEIVAAMPEAAEAAVKPETRFVESPPRQLGPQLADLLVGMVWGLGFVPTEYPHQA